MYLSAVLRDEQSGEVLGLVPMPAHKFKTGSTGFMGCAKVVLADGQRYQVSISAVRIGSRAEADAAQGGQAEPGAEDGR